MDDEDDLVAFLNARLDEAGKRAHAMEHFTVPEQPYYSCAGSRTEPYGDLEWGEEHCDCFLAERKARALREVEADRALLAAYDAAAATYRVALDAHARDATPGRPRTKAWLDTTAAVMAAWQTAVRHRAAVWSDHPDYRQEWKP